jgi:hypothetical protein
MGLAILAAAVDLVGVVISLVVLPQLATVYEALDTIAKSSATLTYMGFEALGNSLTNVTSFGLYTAAGLVLLPGVLATPDYPRWLARLGIAEWGFSAIATGLLVFNPAIASAPLLLSFLLFAPWVWGSAWWIWHRAEPS